MQGTGHRQNVRACVLERIFPSQRVANQLYLLLITYKSVPIFPRGSVVGGDFSFYGNHFGQTATSQQEKRVPPLTFRKKQRVKQHLHQL